MNVFYLVEIEFPRQHHHIGEPGIEAQALNIGDAELGGDVHLEADLTAVCYGCHIGGDDGIHPGILCGIERLLHVRNIFRIKADVQGKIAFDSGFTADTRYLREVSRCEIVCRMRTHIQLADSEIHRIGSSLNRGAKAVETARRGHYLKFFLVHWGKGW